ncbi:MAG: VWA domain-containing protein [Planctomycetes bacterium]|nr:VWA domain-containing protein [Planctomycetota bacterium]
MRIFHVPVLIAAAALLASGPASAAGLLIADGGLGGQLEIEEHDVRVVVNNGVAVTTVTQVFRNLENRQVEALYVFPVPKGASVANFSMWIGGKEMVGEVVEKIRAREIYDSYKRVNRDPGLLEQNDFRSFEMRIFPIAAGAEQRVQVAYYQELDWDHDTATYVYPLATVARPAVQARTKGKFALNLDVKSAVPIVEVDSPSHAQAFVIAKHSENYAQASLETSGGDLNRDLVLSIRVARPRTGLDVIASRPQGEDGFFCLTLTAGEELAVLDKGMDYVFVLDISGSMGQEGKLPMSREALGAFIAGLGDGDRFEVMSFNVKANPCFRTLQPANDAARQEGRAFLAATAAAGGTVLQPAVQAAYRYKDADRPLNVVLLSDGLTEQRDRAELLQLIQARPGGTRVFCIGVGNDVDKPLLEQLAQDAGGLAAFISRDDNFERQAQAFRRKLMRPVAENVRIEIAGVETYDVEPKVLPNLYHGMPVRLYGRYRGGGTAKVTLRADVGSKTTTSTVDLELPVKDGGNPEIERMWAWHRIDGLLREADRTGSREGAIPEIVRLGEGFSIVTEYTSFLVLENDAEYQRWQIARRNATRVARDRSAQQQVAAQLDALRKKASADVGPAEQARPAEAPAPNVATPSGRPASAPRPGDVDFGSGSPAPSGGRSHGGGGGAFDPLTVGIAAALAGLAIAARRRRVESHKP